MKKVMLLITLSGLWRDATAQAAGCAGQYIYVGAKQPLMMVPVVYYQTADNWYAEGRYNYEALRTMSVYGGKVFEKKGTLSYYASPVVGIVLGQMNGGSTGVNTGFEYKRLLFSSQLQYTFSIQDRTENFIYNWSDLSYQLSDNIYGGISVQHTSIYQSKFIIEKGFFIKVLLSKWSLPVYVFSPAAKERYFVLGLTRDW